MEPFHCYIIKRRAVELVQLRVTSSAMSFENGIVRVCVCVCVCGCVCVQKLDQ